MYNNQYFKLFANCIPVKGFKRSIVCDLQKERFVFIPNDLFNILNKYSGYTIAEIKKLHDNKYNEIIDSYYNYLLENHLGFLCEKEELDLFPCLDLKWQDPAIINNAIIEVDNHSTHDFNTIFNQLSELSCQNLQVIFYDNVGKEGIHKILKLLDETTILFLELIIPKPMEVLEKDYLELFERFPRLYNLYLYGCNEFKIVPLKNPSGNLIYIKNHISDSNSCGYIHPNHFTINTIFFTESQKYNTCLNKKISIDRKGNVKNCPFMDSDYGNVKEVRLLEVLKNDRFKDKWFICKDKIKVCKDCEFRYICQDCRINIQNREDIYSKPKRCSYDPYTASGF